MKQLIMTIALSMCIGFVYADTTTNLLDTLHDSGKLTDDEYKTLSNQHEEETLTQRADRRATALRVAQDIEAKEKAKENAKTDVKGKLKDGSLVFESTDKNFSFAPTVRLQLDYRKFGGDAAGATANTFDIRRGFLGLKGKFYGSYEWLIIGDFGGGNGASVLDEAYLNVNYWKEAQFRVGQFKMPFSLEEMTSDLFTDFMERSMGNSMVPNKERGIMVHGTPWAGTTYALALSTGQGKNANETVNTVDSNDIIARGTINFAELFSWKDTVVHLGVGYTTGTEPIGAAVSGRTESRGIIFFTPSTFTGADLSRTRTGLEGVLAYKNFKIQTEMMSVNYSGVSAANVGYDKKITSNYVDIMWMITGEHYADRYKDGKFDRMKPKKDFDYKTLSGGGWEVGIRFSQFNADDFATGKAGTGVIPTSTASAAFTTSATSITYGVNWILNPRTRLMLNYVDTKFNSPVIVSQAASTPSVAKTNGEKVIMMRLQYDF